MQKARTFHRGLGNVKVKDKEAVKAELMVMLGINNDISYTAHINGRRIHTPAQEIGIEQVLMRYGVAKTDIWDN